MVHFDLEDYLMMTTPFLVRKIPYGRVILVAFCLAGFGISLFINFPGFMSWDSADQLVEARQGVYSDWHPPFMAVLWHFTDKIIHGPFGMLLIITALIWLGTLLVTLYWFNKYRSTPLSLLPAFIIFFPPVFSILGAIWKDNLMLGLLIIAIGTAGSIEPVSPTRRSRTYVKLGIVAILLLMAMLARHNAGFAAAPIMMLSIARSIGKRPRLYRVAVSGVIAVLVSVVLQLCAGRTTESLATYKTNVWASLAIFDVAGIIYRMPDHQQQQISYGQVPDRIRGPGSLDRLLETYSPGNYWNMFWTVRELRALRSNDNSVNRAIIGNQPAFGCVMDKDPSAPPNNWFDTYCFELTEQEKVGLMKLWSTLVMHHPLAWLSHKLAVFRYLIGQHRYDSVYMDQHPVDWGKEIYDGSTPQLSYFQTKIKQMLVQFTPIYRPWIYLVLTISVIAACVSSLTERRFQIALIAASGLSYEGGIFLLAPSSDYRYSQYMIYTSIVALLLLMQTCPIGYLLRPLTTFHERRS
jgi:hypothetical protein